MLNKTIKTGVQTAVLAPVCKPTNRQPIQNSWKTCAEADSEYLLICCHLSEPATIFRTNHVIYYVLLHDHAQAAIHSVKSCGNWMTILFGQTSQSSRTSQKRKPRPSSSIGGKLIEFTGTWQGSVRVTWPSDREVFVSLRLLIAIV